MSIFPIIFSPTRRRSYPARVDNVDGHLDVDDEEDDSEDDVVDEAPRFDNKFGKKKIRFRSIDWNGLLPSSRSMNKRIRSREIVRLGRQPFVSNSSAGPTRRRLFLPGENPQ